MNAFANLASGGSIVVWQTSGGISFQRFDASFHAVGPVGTFAASAGAWLSVAPLGNGGFSLIWDSNAASTPAAQDFDANGAAVGSTYAVAVPPIAQNAAFTTRDQPATIVLADGSYAVATSPSNTSVHIQHYDAAGNPAGPEFVDNMATAGFSAAQITPIFDGGYLVIYRRTTSSVTETIIHRFRPDGTWQSTSSPASYSGPGAPTLANQAIAALPEGGFVIVWTAVDSTGAHVHRMEFDGVGATLVADQVLGDVAGNAAPTIDVFPTGRYEISWTSPAGVQHSSFTRASGAVTPGTNDLIKVGLTSYTLPVGPHNMLLVGTSAQTVTGNSQDNVITANEYASTLNGGGGNDTLIASHNGVILNGGSGADKFAYPFLPWGAGHVTDFTVGTDRLDFSALFQASGYNGSNPAADGYMRLDSDGAGGTLVYYDPDGAGASSGWALVTTLDHLSPNGLTVAALLGQSGGGTTAHTVSDFNADQHTDILWQNDSGQAAMWLMNGFTPTTASLVGANPGPAWHEVDTADFNGDGKSDILWQNQNGQVAIWTMDGLTPLGGTLVGSVPGPSWHVKDTGDFNGDGKPDILWQNDNGPVSIWTMDGLTPLTGSLVGSDPGSSWHIKAAADFNADGKSDILWQNDNGQVSIWLMNGVTPVAGSLVGTNPGPSWQVKGASDFNGDGMADILWQNVDGAVSIWTMNGLTPLSGSLVGNNPGPSWHVKGMGDFNADGKTDIVWQNDNGQVAIWTMNGISPLAGSLVGPNPGTAWHVLAMGS